MALVWLAAAWLAGLASGFGGWSSSGWGAFAWVGLILLALALLAPQRLRAIVLLGALVGVGALGLWRTTLAAPTLAALPSGEIGAIRGVVLDWPTRGAQNDTAQVAVDEARAGSGWNPARARVRVTLPLAPAVGKGDRIEVSGRFEVTERITLVGFREYLARQGLHGQFTGRQSRILAVGTRAGPDAWRVLGLATLEERLRLHIPGAEGALVTGVLLGDDNYLPPSTQAAFTRTSTSHIMALSGWNIAIIAGLCALIGAAPRSQPLASLAGRFGDRDLGVRPLRRREPYAPPRGDHGHPLPPGRGDRAAWRCAQRPGAGGDRDDGARSQRPTRCRLPALLRRDGRADRRGGAARAGLAALARPRLVGRADRGDAGCGVVHPAPQLAPLRAHLARDAARQPPGRATDRADHGGGAW